MRGRQGFFLKYAMTIGGCLVPSFFIGFNLFADTVTLKNGKDVKGLVVEKHIDRIILSTERGEIPVLLSGIREIRYDDAEQNFFAIGKAYEAEQKYGEALAFYQKAMEINPAYDQARQAAAAVQNRFWAASIRGPAGEVEKKQALYDAWEYGQSAEDLFEKQAVEAVASLKDGLGITLGKEGDWTLVVAVASGKPAAAAGLRARDRLVAIDGESLRYLDAELVTKKLLEPRFSNFILEAVRDCTLPPGDARNLGGLGLRLEMKYAGLSVRDAKPGSPAARAGLKAGDLIVSINGQSTRYLPMGKVSALIGDAGEGRYVFSIRRPFLLSRR